MFLAQDYRERENTKRITMSKNYCMLYGPSMLLYYDRHLKEELRFLQHCKIDQVRFYNHMPSDVEQKARTFFESLENLKRMEVHM